MSDIITIHNKQFTPYLTYADISDRIDVLGNTLSEDYENKEPVFLAILNGSFMFAADLLKQVTVDCTISFVKLASYQGTSSTGEVISLIGLEEEFENRHVIILEDIVDTGQTLMELKTMLNKHQPASVRTVSLLVKPGAIEHDVKVEYTGFEIPNEFIVGYGLDYDGLGRNLKDIYQIIE